MLKYIAYLCKSLYVSVGFGMLWMNFSTEALGDDHGLGRPLKAKTINLHSNVATNPISKPSQS